MKYTYCYPHDGSAITCWRVSTNRKLLKPHRFYSCFISYSFSDQDFAERLYAGLRDYGGKCWYAPRDIHGGQKVIEQIDEAINRHDKLLLILSRHSITSEWVKTEIRKARKRERREGRNNSFRFA